MHPLIDLEFKPYQITEPRTYPTFAGRVGTQYKIDNWLMWHYPQKTTRKLLRYQKVVKNDVFCNEPIYEEFDEKDHYYEFTPLNAPKRKSGEGYKEYGQRVKVRYSVDYFESNLMVGPEQAKAKGYNKWINEIQVGDFVKCRGQRTSQMWKMITTIDHAKGSFTNMQFYKPINDTKYVQGVGTENAIHDIKEKYAPVIT